MTKTTASPSFLFSIKGGLLVASLLIGGSLALALLTPEVISKALSLRLLGVMLGAFVLVYANAVPKVLPPVMRGDAAAEQGMRRFTGWCLALGGAAYMLVWMFAPIEYANLLAMFFLFAAHVVVIARGLWRRKRPTRA
ncbi:MAG: hypothetical protein ABI664_13105 [bacterium]